MNKFLNRKKNNLKVGDTYHSWIVVGEPTKDEPWHVRCRCRCGTNKLVAIQSLTSGRSKSCSRSCSTQEPGDEEHAEIRVSPNVVMGEIL